MHLGGPAGVQAGRRFPTLCSEAKAKVTEQGRREQGGLHQRQGPRVGGPRILQEDGSLCWCAAQPPPGWRGEARAQGSQRAGEFAEQRTVRLDPAARAGSGHGSSAPLPGRPRPLQCLAGAASGRPKDCFSVAAACRAGGRAASTEPRLFLVRGWHQGVCGLALRQRGGHCHSCRRAACFRVQPEQHGTGEGAWPGRPSCLRSLCRTGGPAGG
mmetsp:Transcript_33343/g.92140  ORF Transcript_33343/g.92140 Transcript_33343/m.92140 type:complete len:213 (-) Transcript_33343:2540-3178(-)